MALVKVASNPARPNMAGWVIKKLDIDVEEPRLH